VTLGHHRVARFHLAVAVAFMVGLVGIGAVAAVEPPPTPAGQQLVWVLDTLNSGESPSVAAIEQHFSPAFLEVVPPDQLVQALAPIAAGRPLRVAAVLSQQDAVGLQVRVDASDGARYRVTIEVGATPPHLIEGLLFESLPTYSLYVRMRDGIRLAVDVRLPSGRKRGERLPAILRSTRYWRTSFHPDPFPAAGYASVVADVRGTGASFGTWEGSPSPKETADLGQLVDWIAAQPWSNGRVGAFGISYPGTTAEMTAAARPKALKVIAPLFSNAEPYSEVARPGGIYDWAHLKRWTEGIKLLDSGRLPDGATVAPVYSDGDGKLLALALRQHQNNFDVSKLARRAVFIDDRISSLAYSWAKAAAWTSRRYVEQSGVPVYALDSWYDAAYVNTALRRYALTSNRQTVTIGSWDHGGSNDADPFHPVDARPTPSQDEQMRGVRAFFDSYLKPDGAAPTPPQRGIRYSTLGATGYRFTTVWPPRGLTFRRLYLAAARSLAWARPRDAVGADRYRVRFDATTGTHNRWWTLAGGGDVFYPNRAEEDAKLLTYTTPPLPRTVEMTGTGVVSLKLSSTARDGAFFAYLEDIAPDGQIRMITEGQLRAVNRKVIAERSPLAGFGPLHSFRRADARPLVPGRVAELRIGLLPTSVVFEKGHRIRLAIAGADKDTFSRIPATGTPTISVHHSSVYLSYIELPLRNR
jgi:putative CocE/NonD family hydrolase